MRSLFALSLSAAAAVAAHKHNHVHNHNPRQTPGPSLTFASTNPTAVPLAAITSGAATQTTAVLKPTLVPTPGATGPVKGAPALPSWTYVEANWPTPDVIPPTDSAQVQAWIQEVKNSGVTIPGYQPTVNDADCASNAAAAADANRCWWTCGQCTRDTDITTCPDKLTWGLSYDDGPSDYTADLLNFLDDQQKKATFFVVGSRVMYRSELLQAEYMAGHQLSVHTWSHHALTTLTNEQIIAELGWTREAIRQVTGVTPNTMRPPFGDIDDRVRAICQAMKLTPVMWTNTASDQQFDTEDWAIASGESVDKVISNFETILSTAETLNTGFIVLEHDLYQQTVDLAVGYILPDALARRNPQFNLMSINQCMHKPLENTYVETNDNTTNPFSSNAQPGTGGTAVTTTASGTIVTAASLTTSKATSKASTASAGAQTTTSASGAGRNVVLTGGAVLAGALSFFVLL